VPGTYKVRLTIGDKTYEQSVEVRLDPRVTVPAEDLRGQLDLLLKLRDMQTAASTALRYLDSVKDQLKHTETTVKSLNKEPDKELMKALADYQKQVDDIETRIARSPEPSLGLPGGLHVLEKLGGLFGTIDSFNGAPTSGQREYFRELEPEFRDRMNELNRFISDTIPQWNDKLRAWNAPTLTTRKPVEF
jgi:hypothetical protein